MCTEVLCLYQSFEVKVKQAWEAISSGCSCKAFTNDMNHSIVFVNHITLSRYSIHKFRAYATPLATLILYDCPTMPFKAITIFSTDRPTDKPTYRSSFPELKKLLKRLKTLTASQNNVFYLRGAALEATMSLNSFVCLSRE